MRWLRRPLSTVCILGVGSVIWLHSVLHVWVYSIVFHITLSLHYAFFLHVMHGLISYFTCEFLYYYVLFYYTWLKGIQQSKMYQNIKPVQFCIGFIVRLLQQRNKTIAFILSSLFLKEIGKVHLVCHCIAHLYIHVLLSHSTRHHRPVDVKRAVTGPKDGWMLRALLKSNVLRDRSIIN